MTNASELLQWQPMSFVSRHRTYLTQYNRQNLIKNIKKNVTLLWESRFCITFRRRRVPSCYALIINHHENTRDPSSPFMYSLWSWRGLNPRPNKENINFLHAYFRLWFSWGSKTWTTNCDLILKKIHPTHEAMSDYLRFCCTVNLDASER